MGVACERNIVVHFYILDNLGVASPFGGDAEDGGLHQCLPVDRLDSLDSICLWHDGRENAGRIAACL